MPLKQCYTAVTKSTAESWQLCCVNKVFPGKTCLAHCLAFVWILGIFTHSWISKLHCWEMTRLHTVQGKEKLKQLSVYRKKWRKSKCCCIFASYWQSACWQQQKLCGRWDLSVTDSAERADLWILIWTHRRDPHISTQAYTRTLPTLTDTCI